jgi:hypothetical protein
MAGTCDLAVLRIDGAVGTEKRQKIVDFFNRCERITATPLFVEWCLALL